jgi:trehalose synthase
MPPSIDPLSDKNKEIPWSFIEKTLNRYEIDPEKPILLQVARFDPWKDPFAAIDVYRIVKRKIPDTQLLLVTAMATDDPEGWDYFEKVTRYAGMDNDIHILTNLKGVGSLEVNAFQRAATVVLQMSIREGFGLAVTEALWKKKPVIARPRGGIKLQVINGVTGYLVETVEEAAEKTLYLIKHPDKRRELGENGYKHVLKNFIITKHLERYLKLFKLLTQTK